MVKKIAITGAAGQIAYSLLFRVASGELLGQKEPIALHLLDKPNSLKTLKGIAMELEDCAFPLLKKVVIGTDPVEVFHGVDYVFLIGAKPRGPGMERKDLLEENGKIFVEQGKALDKSASKNALVLVIGNPCNTNCLLALRHAKSLSPKHFYCMTYLDQQRAQSMLAKEAGAEIQDVQNVIIWGNHSTTQVPDFINAKIRGHGVEKIIQDRKWLEGRFVPAVQKRGAEVIAARGKSSAASAAHAALLAMKKIIFPSDDVFSMGVFSDHNPYKIANGLVFSFPCISKGNGDLEIANGFHWDHFLKEKIALSEKELLEERESIKGLL